VNYRIVFGILLLTVAVLGLLGIRLVYVGDVSQRCEYVFWLMGRGPTGQPPLRSEARLISLDKAAELARRYVTSLGNPDLDVKEVMEFELNFYFIVYEKSTGIGAFEMLIDRYGGWIRPEPGPNMMWNTKYGMMRSMSRGGMVGGWSGTPTSNVTVTAEQAEKIVAEFLRGYLPGTSMEEPDVFYGYYTFHVLRAGRTYGMLSVNGYSGQVWYHNWHGAFIAMKELH
jgi:hypothetical protein